MVHDSASRTATAPAAIANPFTQSWIQALTLAADNPLARTIKTKLEWVDRLSKNRPDEDRLQAAQELWSFGESEGLLDLLKILPVQQATWVFDRDDMFLFQRREMAATEATSITSFDAWAQALGLMPASFELTAEVTSTDWSGLVRSEAVRLQHAHNVTAVQQGSTLQLPCTALWDSKSWKVRFDQVDWIVVAYEDPAVVQRPTLAEIEESLMWLIATANDKLISKTAGACPMASPQQAWFACVPRLKKLHESLHAQSRSLSPWLPRVWNCVWPIVYREQNVLNGKADVQQIRGELKACLTAQPRLTMWMFVFARLVCQAQLGMGLGFLADFHD